MKQLTITLSEDRTYFAVKILETEIFIDLEHIEKLLYSDYCSSGRITWKKNEKGELYFTTDSKKKINLLEQLFDKGYENYIWTFKNKNKNDLRKKNVIIEEIERIKFPENIEILKSFEGHKPTFGIGANKEFNHYWLVKDKITNETFYAMQCSENSYTSLSVESLEKVLKYKNTDITWFPVKNKFICTSIDGQAIYLHKYLLNFTNDGTSKVRHINGNNFDNRLTNLKIVPFNRKKIKSIKPKDVVSKTDVPKDRNIAEFTFEQAWKNYNVSLIKWVSVVMKQFGKTANLPKNQVCLVCDNITKKKFYMMYCDVGAITLLSNETNIDEIHKQTWYLLQNGYVGTHLNDTIVYLHQVIANHIDSSDGLSVDHINRNKLDNRIENLRITTQSVQNSNMNRKTRPCNAIHELPDEIKTKQLPKYVSYCFECYDKKNNKTREFFRIENHPFHPKTISSSKSSKVSITDKLKEVEEIIDALNKKTYKEKEPVYPKYISVVTMRGAPHFVLDHKLHKPRLNLKMKIHSDDTESELEKFKKKILEKYPKFVFEN
jgi:hypothetical protein